MSISLGRRGSSKFQQAATGAMSLMDHLRELRSRLFKASLAVLGGLAVGWWLAPSALDILKAPYCDLTAQGGVCEFVQLGVPDTFVLQMKVALWLGLIVAAPVWLYQVWAFIAPGLHKHERRWAYAFTAIATPLFAGGAVMAYFVVAKGLEFLLQFNGPHVRTTLAITNYIDFVTGLMWLFGLAFEFPLVVLLLNISGLVSARKLLGWWRIAVFMTFAFAAIATPTADPFGMTFLGLALSTLYFAAVGAAFLNDRRRRRRDQFADLDDDEASPLPDAESAQVAAGEPIDPVMVAPLDSRYDETT